VERALCAGLHCEGSETVKGAGAAAPCQRGRAALQSSTSSASMEGCGAAGSSQQQKRSHPAGQDARHLLCCLRVWLGRCKSHFCYCCLQWSGHPLRPLSTVPSLQNLGCHFSSPPPLAAPTTISTDLAWAALGSCTAAALLPLTRQLPQMQVFPVHLRGLKHDFFCCLLSNWLPLLVWARREALCLRVNCSVYLHVMCVYVCMCVCV
jgi:hypothetical protein